MNLKQPLFVIELKEATLSRLVGCMIIITVSFITCILALVGVLNRDWNTVGFYFPISLGTYLLLLAYLQPFITKQ